MENSVLLNELMAMLGPIVATIVSTIMGTEAFKWILDKTGLNISSRTVTWIVWGLVALVVWLIMDLLPLWLVVVLGLVAIGIYAGWLKPLLTNLGIGKRKANRDYLG